ncbi:copper chaperone PCu(A)C [Propionivibrio sp.]|jgi:copper(I)-binding protein|uniref:copper chaperone PCu(A)C n=1 Tax=Propionivibrio sp. TaxID=2212460 RepID=UPI00272E6FCB|nr:copper chaperone PCu(A)C [Propionivibrio sp.]
MKFAKPLIITLVLSAIAGSALADSVLSVHAPYVRLMPPGIKTTGSFMLIKNDGDDDRRLVRADSPAARIVELHTHLNENGVMKMRAVPHIEVKSHSQTELKPGSFHVMLIDLTAPLNEGDKVPITLEFDDGSTIELAAPVKKPHAAMPMPHR